MSDADKHGGPVAEFEDTAEDVYERRLMAVVDDLEERLAIVVDNIEIEKRDPNLTMLDDVQAMRTERNDIVRALAALAAV